MSLVDRLNTIAIHNGITQAEAMSVTRSEVRAARSMWKNDLSWNLKINGIGDFAEINIEETKRGEDPFLRYVGFGLGVLGTFGLARALWSWGSFRMQNDQPVFPKMRTVEGKFSVHEDPLPRILTSLAVSAFLSYQGIVFCFDAGSKNQVEGLFVGRVDPTLCDPTPDDVTAHAWQALGFYLKKDATSKE